MVALGKGPARRLSRRRAVARSGAVAGGPQVVSGAWLITFGKAIVRLRLVRGTYLDQMVTFEGVLDSHLYSYIGGPEEHRWLAYYSFLKRMGLRAKVETFCQSSRTRV